MYRTADGREIGHAIVFSCPDSYRPLVWHDSWEEFSEDEKHATLEALQAFVEQQAEGALVTPTLQSR